MLAIAAAIYRSLEGLWPEIPKKSQKRVPGAYNPPHPPTPTNPRPSTPKSLISVHFGCVWLRFAPFGCVWLRFGSVSGLFRVRFGSFSGCWVGSGRGAFVREKNITTSGAVVRLASLH